MWFMGRATAAGVTLGIGLGSFLDGIVLHQIAQWHNMGSAVVPPVTMEAKIEPFSLSRMGDGGPSAFGPHPLPVLP
jgi:uncharacterized membrane protein